MSECIFCRIAAGEIPARIVHTDEEVVVFHDLAPQAPTHLLVIPKRHIASAADATASDSPLLGRLISTACDLARRLELDGFRLVVNSGESAGQSVFHLHLHLLGGRRFSWPPG